MTIAPLGVAEPDLPPPPEQLFDADFFRLASECTVEAWLAFLGHRWSALTLYHLARGPKRFGELAAALPTATPKVLAERLIALERHGLIRRPTGARGEAYALTEKGLTLSRLLDRLEIWSRDFPKVDQSR
jgi:DNA-binding HxlR family transcriptional regulator